jgi:hypothetical protein
MVFSPISLLLGCLPPSLISPDGISVGLVFLSASIYGTPRGRILNLHHQRLLGCLLCLFLLLPLLEVVEALAEVTGGGPIDAFSPNCSRKWLGESHLEGG